MRARHTTWTLSLFASIATTGCFFPDYTADLEAEVSDGGGDETEDASNADVSDLEDGGPDTSATQDASCGEGLRRCSGATPQTCGDAGAWVDDDPCPYACSSGICTGTCVPKSKQCDGKTLQTCDTLGEWKDGDVCPSNCVDGACVDRFTVGGTVSGLEGSGLVLVNNDGDEQPITADGSYAFATLFASGATYEVTVKTQPSYPAAEQECTVTNGTGTVADANVTNVEVSCTSNEYKVGGTVTGLQGTGLVLQNNGGDDEAISEDGTFTFETSVKSGAMFNVAIGTQPDGGQVCWVSKAAGTVGAGDVTSVVVKCAEPATGQIWETLRSFSDNDSNNYPYFTAGLGETVYFTPTKSNGTAFNVVNKKFNPWSGLRSTEISGMCACGIAGTLVPASGSLFYFGGIGGRLDPATLKWTELSSYVGEVLADGAAPAVLGDRIYRIGGKAVPDNGGGDLNTVRYYDTVRDKWVIDLNTLPSTIKDGCGGALNGKIYVWGGNGSATYVYDPDADSWTTLPDGDIHSECYNRLGYAWRGTLIYASRFGIEQFDPATNKWAQPGPLGLPPNSLPSIAAVVLDNDDLYVVGGANGSTTVYRLNDN